MSLEKFYEEIKTWDNLPENWLNYLRDFTCKAKS